MATHRTPSKRLSHKSRSNTSTLGRQETIIQMSRQQYLSTIEGTRIIYQDDVGISFESDTIGQAALVTVAFTFGRDFLSQPVPDEHFCESGYECIYMVSVRFDG